MKTTTLVSLLAMLLLLPLCGLANTLTTADELSVSGPEALSPDEQSLIDHTATANFIKGKAQIMKKGSSDWVKLERGALIEEGDQIKTGGNSFTEIFYDRYLLNHLRIDANTIAMIHSIEPTQIELIDGNLFNILDGLPAGSTFEVTSPTAVASVRGTVFVLGYNAAAGTDQTAVLEGAVNVLPYDPVTGIVRESQAKVVKEKEVFQLHQAEQPGVMKRAMSEEERIDLGDAVNQSKVNLLLYAGGPEQYKLAHRKWFRLKEKYAKMQRITEALQAHGQNTLLTANMTGLLGEKEMAESPKEDKAFLTSSVVKKTEEEEFQEKMKDAVSTYVGGTLPENR